MLSLRGVQHRNCVFQEPPFRLIVYVLLEAHVLSHLLPLRHLLQFCVVLNIFCQARIVPPCDDQTNIIHLSLPLAQQSLPKRAESMDCECDVFFALVAIQGEEIPLHDQPAILPLQARRFFKSFEINHRVQDTRGLAEAGVDRKGLPNDLLRELAVHEHEIREQHA